MLPLQVLCQLCDRPCLCPGPPPQCPSGVPLVLDGCRCCQVCARQRGDPCTKMLPCDSQRGLECDYSASFPGAPGECVSECIFFFVCVGETGWRTSGTNTQLMFRVCPAEQDGVLGGGALPELQNVSTSISRTAVDTFPLMTAL